MTIDVFDLWEDVLYTGIGIAIFVLGIWIGSKMNKKN